jgi:hypothetical protein
MRYPIRLVSIGVAITTLMASAAGPASAAESAPRESAHVHATPAEIAAGRDVEAQMHKFTSTLTMRGGTMQFDAAAAIRMGGDPDIVQDVATGVLAGGGTVTGIRIRAAAVRTIANLARTTAAKSSCAGKTNISGQWFGLQIKLNSCDTNRLVAAMTGGGGIGAIITVLASSGIGTVAAGVAAGILAIGAGIVGWCAANGRGVILDYSYVGASWCASQ